MNKLLSVSQAQLSANQAQLLHGRDGDGCWNEKRCPRRRSHYRHRRELNEKRRLAYQQQVTGTVSDEGQVEIVALPVSDEVSVPYANLYIWRERRKDVPIHAIAATIFQNGSKVLEVKAIHCAGYRKRQLEQYVQKNILGYLRARFGITFFADEIRLEPIECPIKDRPWGDRLASEGEGCSERVEVADD